MNFWTFLHIFFLKLFPFNAINQILLTKITISCFQNVLYIAKYFPNEHILKVQLFPINTSFFILQSVLIQ